MAGDRQKWPDFEAAFHGFVPAYWQQVPPDVLEALAMDERIVRNLQKSARCRKTPA